MGWIGTNTPSRLPVLPVLPVLPILPYRSGRL
jgi:hypothetical protein